MAGTCWARLYGICDEEDCGGGAGTPSTGRAMQAWNIFSATVYAASMEVFNECEGAQRRESEVRKKDGDDGIGWDKCRDLCRTEVWARVHTSRLS
jgi:hypothetical protein